jgi:nitrite reductase/ring-hydroxylating ferredoxin subunit
LNMTWIRAGALADLKSKPLVLKHEARQIALFHVDGKVFAIDNRCPHEGYPLAAGSVSPDCVLTCNWHNWKFRLQDGQCVIGGDNVRSYAARVDEGQVLVDVAAPPLEETRRQVFIGLRKAFQERDYGRLCREIARLHFNGLDPKDAIREAIVWSHDRLEYGAADTHAYAATTDWLALADLFAPDFEKQLACFAESVDHMAFDSLRRPTYPYGTRSDTPFHSEGFLAAIEAERSADAEGMILRALDDGLHWADLEPTLAKAALAHYNDFGHSVIYVPKTADLIHRLGEDVERFLLPPLVRQFCYATREDLVPDFKVYAATLRSLPEPALESSASSGALAAPFPCNLPRALDWLSKCLATHPVVEVYDTLLTGVAQNLLHYDAKYGTAFDRPVQHNVSWLGFTHGVTFSNAVRVVCSKYPSLWRPGLLQMACFLGRNYHYLDPSLDTKPWQVGDRSAFLAATHEQLLDHGINEPVIAAHLLKTTLAVEAELPSASPVCQDALLAGLNRYLHSSVKGKHVRRLARHAIGLVAKDF